MSRFVQLHLLTAYPPSNLNRDDSGRPKTAIMGGAQRLRISSQSLKRAWRTSDVFLTFDDHARRGSRSSRTQRATVALYNTLIEKDISREVALKITRGIASVVGKAMAESKVKDRESDFQKLLYTEQLIFITPSEHKNIVDLADHIISDEKLSALLSTASSEVEGDEAENDEESPKARKSKEKKISKKVADELRERIFTRNEQSVDLAMFGRMIADAPKYNVEAAVQVAHAITTHKAMVEDDYYVAVDDLKDSASREDAGTSFIGVSEYGAGVFYVYLCIDTALLKANLAGDAALAQDAVEALVRAASTVAPRGKQASFASRARASFLLAEAGDTQPRSLAAAFLVPVPERSNDPLRASVERLLKLKADFAAGYGEAGLSSATMDLTGDTPAGTLDAVVSFVRAAVA